MYEGNRYTTSLGLLRDRSSLQKKKKKLAVYIEMACRASSFCIIHARRVKKGGVEKKGIEKGDRQRVSRIKISNQGACNT